MSQETYKTINSPTEGIYKDKGSRFLSFAIPVTDINEVKEIVKEFRKKYFDARHICYAFVLGYDKEEWRANDDGEPSGTAGRPILGQIHSKELTNVIVIVVRYFGGVLLGTGGLINAYKQASADALNNSKIVEKNVEQYFSVEFDYIFLNDVMRILKNSSCQITSQSFDKKVCIQFQVILSKALQVTENLKKIQRVHITEKVIKPL